MTPHKPEDLTAELSEELMPPETADIDDDIDVPKEVETWVDETKGVERIISVAITTSKPRTADWIGEQAQVSEQTARDHLQTFAELGVIASFTSSGVTRYHADEAFLHYREVSRCVEQYTKEELSELIEDYQEQIDQIKTEHEVEVPDDLRAKAASEDIKIAELRQFKKTAAEWETYRDQLEVFEDAVRRFDKFTRQAVGRV